MIDDRPSAAQDLILRATFLSGDPGLEAWRDWKSTVDLDGPIDLGSYRLLPVLSRRLSQRGIAEPLQERFAGISKKHWLANRIVLREVEPVLKSLGARNVRVMLPAEMALAFVHYSDYSLDPHLGPSILVDADQAIAAFQALEAVGWRATPPVAASLLHGYVSARSWHPFRGPTRSRLRVCWHVLSQRATKAVDDGYWSRATEVSISGVTVGSLSPTDQVVQLCTQRVGWRIAPLFTRAVDVMMLLSVHLDRIDWKHLVEKSAELQLNLPIKETLAYLQSRLDEPMPSHVLAQIQAHPESISARLESQVAGKRAGWLGEALGFWLDYRRMSTTTLLAGVVRLPQYLQRYLKLPHLWQLPFRAMAIAVSHLRMGRGKAIRRP